MIVYICVGIAIGIPIGIGATIAALFTYSLCCAAHRGDHYLEGR